MRALGRCESNRWNSDNLAPLAAPAVTLRQCRGRGLQELRTAVTELSKAVFLGYASQDAVAATRISETLRSAGIEVWSAGAPGRHAAVDRLGRAVAAACRHGRRLT